MTPPAAKGDGSLTSSTVHGLKWTYLGTIITGVAQLAYTATMSRLLAPELFGIFAIGTLTVQFATYFAKMGIAQAIIQKPDLADDDIRAGYTSAVVLGAVFSTIIVLTAPFVGAVFQQPEAVPVLRVLGLTFVVQGLANTAAALLQRDLRFRHLVLAETGAFTFGYLVVGIPMAIAGAGVWSLVIGTLCQALFATTAKVVLRRHPKRPLLRAGPYRRLLSYGAALSFGQVTEFLGGNLDTFAVGRWATAGLLGQYNRAYYLVNVPFGYLVQALSQVLFPSLSRIQDDISRLRRAYVDVISTAGLVILPAAAGLAVAADEVVMVTIGPQWDIAASVVPLMAVAGAARLMSRFSSVVLEARAQLGWRNAIQIGHVALLAGLLALAVGGELQSYAIALMVAELVRHAAYILAMWKLTGLRGVDAWRAYGPALGTAVIVSGMIWLVREATVALGVAVALVFLLELLTGALTLAISLRLPPLRAVRHRLTRAASSADLIGTNRGGPVATLITFVLGVEATLDREEQETGTGS